MIYYLNFDGVFENKGLRENKPLLQEEEVEESRGLNDSVCVR